MGAMYFLTFGLPGTVIGLIARKGAKPGDALLASATAELLGKMAGVLALYLLYHVNAFSPAAADIEKSIAAYGVPTVNREALREVIDRVVLLMPCAFIIFSAAEAFSCLMLLSHMRRRRGGEALFSPPPFREWRFPRSVLFAMLAGIVFRYAAESQDGLYLARQMGANLSELSKGIFALQGLSCAYFFMERAKIPKAARVAAVIFALALPLMWSVLSVIGVADMGFNFRENKEGAR
jgi:uncharacterized protein YybS (DUF2232 family)